MSEDLQTVAESSDWQATSTHAEVALLCEKLAASSERVHVEDAGQTQEGRSLPILIVADPPVRTPEDVGGRLVAFAWAGIHSGEVCGKPAVLMLTRELALIDDPTLLEDLVIVFLPLLNADGNDRMDPDNRPGQLGPVEGMGTRPNAQGLNINRDFTKLATLEARALAGVLNRWDPAVVMDLHTTNGSKHQYTLTYDGQRHPACDPALMDLTREELLPAVTASIEAESGYKTIFYGNFNREHTTWTTYPGQPRYSTHYLGLRHHIGLLSEAYSYATYRDRVFATIAFVRHSFQYVADHKAEVKQAIAAAQARAPQRLCLRQRTKMSDDTITVLGYEPTPRGEPLGEPRGHVVRHDLSSESTLSVAMPHAYLLPADAASVIENLRLHGARLETLTRETRLDVEVYRIESITRSRRDYEDHNMLEVDVESRTEPRTFAAGTVLVRTNQPLGTLAAYLLEPQAEDGLCAWNFFDDRVAEGADFPVVRVLLETEFETR